MFWHCAFSLVLLALALPLALLGAVGDRPERIEAPGIENLHRLAPNLYSGGQPEGEAAFSALKRLGVRTIISVDGARPDIETAHQQGLRYVHLPIGYDGVPPEQAARLVKAIRTLPGPVFIHCHHGKHRGPAAAAVCGIATEGWNKEQARHWLEQAGTSADYKGLFTSVDRFTPPTDVELSRITAAELPEAAEVSALVEAMVQIDATWDHLKAIEKAGFLAPKDAPDLDPPHEALMLTESFQELLRLEETQAKGEAFIRLMNDSEQAAKSLSTTLKALDPANPVRRNHVARAFTRVADSCNACHRRFRDD